MLPVGALFAFIGRQLGRVLSLAFAWATTALFGRVPESKQLLLSAMAGAALAWPIVLAGVAFPSVATFLLAFVTLPEWAHEWVRPVMVVLALVLPLAVGYLSTRPHASAEGRCGCARGAARLPDPHRAVHRARVDDRAGAAHEHHRAGAPLAGRAHRDRDQAGRVRRSLAWPQGVRSRRPA